MANQATNTIAERWTSALYNHRVAQLAWATVKAEEVCSARQQAALSLEDAKQIIFSVPAPDLSGVIEKLSIRWDGSLFNDSLMGKIFRVVIGDLRRLEREAAGIEEPENSGHPVGEDERRAAAWQAALEDFDGKVALIREGHSVRWAGRQIDQLIEGMDRALGALLEAPAPNVCGVVRKLELIWAHNGESLESGAFYAQVINDLTRLVRGAASPVFAPQ